MCRRLLIMAILVTAGPAATEIHRFTPTAGVHSIVAKFPKRALPPHR